MRKIQAVIAIFVLATCLLSGCVQNKAQLTDSGFVIYNTENAVDANNYTIYVNKEINLVLNTLEGHLAISKKILTNTYPVEDEVANLTESIAVIRGAYQSVELMNPPKEYEDNRMAVLRRMNNAINSLENYQEALKDNSAFLSDYLDVIEGDYAALKNVFDIMSE